MVTYKQSNIYHLESKTRDDPTQVPSLSVELSLIRQSYNSDTETIPCTLACPASYPLLPGFLPQLLGLIVFWLKKQKQTNKKAPKLKKKLSLIIETSSSLYRDLQPSQYILHRERCNCQGNDFMDENMRPTARNFHSWRQKAVPNPIQHCSHGPHATSQALECRLGMDCKCEAPTTLGRPRSEECGHLINDFI